MHFFANLIGSQALVLREKEINPTGPCYVRLVGRKSGLIAWLLTLCGVDTTTKLEVYADRVEYSYGSLSGNILEVIPLSKVSNLLCGRCKPVILLFWAVIAFFAVFMTFGLSLILTVVFIVFYFLKKTTLVSIIPNSASETSIAFKRSLIEQKNISDEEAQQIIKIVAMLVEKANSK